jgi:hypothetical protein
MASRATRLNPGPLGGPAKGCEPMQMSDWWRDCFNVRASTLLASVAVACWPVGFVIIETVERAGADSPSYEVLGIFALAAPGVFAPCAALLASWFYVVTRRRQFVYEFGIVAILFAIWANTVALALSEL